LGPSRHNRKESFLNIVAVQDLDLSDYTINDIEDQHPSGRVQHNIAMAGTICPLGFRLGVKGPTEVVATTATVHDSQC